MSSHTHFGCQPGEQAIAKLIQIILTGEEPARSDAFVELQKILLPIARAVLRQDRLSPSEEEEFIAEAMSHVLEKLSFFDPNRGHFRTWAYRVLTNLAIDFQREHIRASTILDTDLNAALSSSVGADAESLEVPSAIDQFECTRFKDPTDIEVVLLPSSSTVKKLETIPALRRVIALAACGLYRLIPPEKWDAWVAEAKISPPFPPPSPEPEATVKDIWKNLGAALNKKPSAIQQNFYRAIPQLREIFRDFGE